MGKNQRSRGQQQKHTRSKFKGEQPKPAPELDSEPLNFASVSTDDEVLVDTGVEKEVEENLAAGEGFSDGFSVEKESEGTGEEMTPVESGEEVSGDEAKSEDEEESSEDDEESDPRLPVRKKKCVKCAQARKQTAKAQAFAKKRRGVRVKDAADKIIDAVKRMKP